MGTKLKVSQNCDLAIQKAKGVLSCTGESSSRSREAILPLCSAPEGLCPVLGLPSTTEMEETEPAFSQWCAIPNRQQVQTKTQGNPFKPKLFCFGFFIIIFLFVVNKHKHWSRLSRRVASIPGNIQNPNGHSPEHPVLTDWFR